MAERGCVDGTCGGGPEALDEEGMKIRRRKYMENTCDPERFLQELDVYGEKDLMRNMNFNTGGMRGLMRSGFNGINEVTCNLVGTELSRRYSSVVIGCDGRHNSTNYGMLLKEVFEHNGKNAWLYLEVPTPFLTFLVCELGAEAGIMVTASHNPREYNGFKVYCSDGSQIGSPLDKEMEESMKMLNMTTLENNGRCAEIMKRMMEGNCLVRRESIGRKNSMRVDEPWRNKLISSYIGSMFKSWDCEMIERIKRVKISVPIAFTGLCGISGEFVRKALEFYNLSEAVHFVDGECVPDPDFPNLPFPNPEVCETFNKAKASGLADIIFSCDPDGDRFGLSEKINGDWVDYNGNEIAAMFMDFFVENFDPSTLVFVNTFLCDDFMKRICSAHGIRYLRTETGFKNVSKAVNSVHGKNVLAYEDSLGFLFGEGREKDGIKCVILMAYLVQKELPSDILGRMRRKYGDASSINLHVRCNDPQMLLEKILRRVHNVRTEEKRSIIEFDSYKIILRISGTESMLKMYSSSNTLDKSSLAAVTNEFADKHIRDGGSS